MEDLPFQSVPVRKRLSPTSVVQPLSTPSTPNHHRPSSTNSFDLLLPQQQRHAPVNKKKRKRKAKVNSNATSMQSSPEPVGLGLVDMTMPKAQDTSAPTTEPAIAVKTPAPALHTKPSPPPPENKTTAHPLPPSSPTSDTISFSFLDYLRDELTASDFDSTQELKRERITNFLGVPSAIEKLMAFGFVVCLDSFLYTFTVLPLRFGLALYHLWHVLSAKLRGGNNSNNGITRLRSSQKCDLLKGLLSIITCAMMWSFDPSRMYHFIRGQAVLKLYVIFNVLEIFDKLCCSVGVDILDALFSKSTLASSDNASHAKRQLKPATLFLLATGYMVMHTTVLFFEMITLNVAINFYSNALLSLLISNQFVEIKQSVFKKFEKENLFQLSCGDIVERFQQSVFLAIITLRNVVELSESSPSSILPSTFVPLFKLPALTTLNTLMTPVLMVLASELIVDWIKHAFITKFNQIRPSIYGKYIDLLCKDLVVGSPSRLIGHNNAFVDQSPVVSRRIGFPSLPLACLVVRMVLPMILVSHGDSGNASPFVNQGVMRLLTENSFLPVRFQQMLTAILNSEWLAKVLGKTLHVILLVVILVAIALCLLAIKVFVGISLLTYAYKRYASMSVRDHAEKVKDKEMEEIGKHEEKHKQETRHYLNDTTDNVMGTMPIKYTLENVDRFSMVRSRIP